MDMIWCEVMNHIKHLENERAVDVPLSFCICKKENDREINKWYNGKNSFINSDLSIQSSVNPVFSRHIAY